MLFRILVIFALAFAWGMVMSLIFPWPYGFIASLLGGFTIGWTMTPWLWEKNRY